MTLDMPGDFPLAWTRSYGNGRVFYTALGHFDDTWRDARFQQMVEQSLLWVTKQIDGDAQPQPVVQPALAPGGIGNSATMLPAMTIFPGSYVSLYGSQLTSGATMTGDLAAPSTRLSGTRVLMNGRAVPIVYASPGPTLCRGFAGPRPGSRRSAAVGAADHPPSGPAASTVVVGSAPVHVTSAVGPYVAGTAFPSGEDRRSVASGGGLYAARDAKKSRSAGGRHRRTGQSPATTKHRARPETAAVVPPDGRTGACTPRL